MNGKAIIECSDKCRDRGDADSPRKLVAKP